MKFLMKMLSLCLFLGSMSALGMSTSSTSGSLGSSENDHPDILNYMQQRQKLVEKKANLPSVIEPMKKLSFQKISLPKLELIEHKNELCEASSSQELVILDALKHEKCSSEPKCVNFKQLPSGTLSSLDNRLKKPELREKNINAFSFREPMRQVCVKKTPVSNLELIEHKEERLEDSRPQQLLVMLDVFKYEKWLHEQECADLKKLPLGSLSSLDTLLKKNELDIYAYPRFWEFTAIRGLRKPFSPRTNMAFQDVMVKAKITAEMIRTFLYTNSSQDLRLSNKTSQSDECSLDDCFFGDDSQCNVLEEYAQQVEKTEKVLTDALRCMRNQDLLSNESDVHFRCNADHLKLFAEDIFDSNRLYKFERYLQYYVKFKKDTLKEQEKPLFEGSYLAVCDIVDTFVKKQPKYRYQQDLEKVQSVILTLDENTLLSEHVCTFFSQIERVKDFVEHIIKTGEIEHFGRFLWYLKKGDDIIDVVAEKIIVLLQDYIKPTK